MNILITGAAGYVGSVITEETVKAGHSVVALDNLSTGHREAVSPEAVFIRGNFGNRALLARIFKDYKIGAVMHVAASTLVSESVAVPVKYFHNNVFNGMNLLDAMVEHGIDKIIFSSSCAVYGHPEKVPIVENTAKNPINPYGETKLMFERLLNWYRAAYKISSVSLRYFNAAGATEKCGENHKPETHLIPLVLKAAVGKGGRNTVSVFGTDYPTRDGTCLRDYVHVADIAAAHILALEYLAENPGCHAFNLGSGNGYSVLDILNAAGLICGKQIKVEYKPRRPGDPPVLVADAKKARIELGWKPRRININEIISDAYAWGKTGLTK